MAGKRSGTVKGAPEILAVEEYLAHGIIAWFDEMLKQYLNKPNSEESKRVVIEAFGIAVRTIVERNPGPHNEAMLKGLADRLTK